MTGKYQLVRQHINLMRTARKGLRVILKPDYVQALVDTQPMQFDSRRHQMLDDYSDQLHPASALFVSLGFGMAPGSINPYDKSWRTVQRPYELGVIERKSGGPITVVAVYSELPEGYMGLVERGRVYQIREQMGADYSPGAMLRNKLAAQEPKVPIKIKRIDQGQYELPENIEPVAQMLSLLIELGLKEGNSERELADLNRNASRFDRSNTHSYLAMQEQKVVSVCVVSRFGENLTLTSCITHADHRRQGHLTSIFNQVKRDFPGEEIMVQAWMDDLESQAVYKAMGFTPFLMCYSWKPDDKQTT